MSVKIEGNFKVTVGDTVVEVNIEELKELRIAVSDFFREREFVPDYRRPFVYPPAKEGPPYIITCSNSEDTAGKAEKYGIRLGIHD